MIRKKLFLFKFSFVILLISILFSILKGSGFYGFGNDYYVIYFENNLNFGSIFNRLGWIVSTLSFKKIHFGVYITTLILSISFGYLLRSVFKLKNINNTLFFSFILLIGVHTWPIIMATSNAMRQGLCMSMIFLSLVFYLEKKIILTIIFLVISMLMHKSGPLIAFIFTFAMLVYNFRHYVNKSKNIYFLGFGFIIFLLTFILVDIFETGSRDSRIIFKDYRYHFLLIGISFLFLSHYLENFLEANFINVFVYYYIFSTFAVFALKLNYEYERLQMMMIIPIIFSVGTIFNKRSSYIFYSFSFLLLLYLTIYNGMYQSFK